MTARAGNECHSPVTGERSRLFEHTARVAEEGNRTAWEVYDALVQGLSAIGLQLASADALLETTEKAECAREDHDRKEWTSEYKHRGN